MSTWNTDFPNLATIGFKATSPQTISYNCIAWAASDSTRWWWPDQQFQYYWPPGIERKETIGAFIQAFGLFGYEECENAEPEGGKEKVALYALFGVPTHAARQLPSGKWTSKLGQNIDIEHTLEGLYGPVYGTVVKILSR